MRNIVLSAILLSLFGAHAAGLVAVVFWLTEARIAANETAVMRDNLALILQAVPYDNDILADARTIPAHPLLGDNEAYVYPVRKAGQTQALIFMTLTRKGYAGNIRLLVGVNADAEIIGVRVITHRETPGLGDDIELQRSNWILSFDGRSLRNPQPERWAVQRDGGVFDQFTGATITPRAVVNAVRDVLIYLEHNPNLIKDLNTHFDATVHHPYLN